MAGRQEIERIVCVEIVRAQIETLRRLSHGFVYPGLLTVLSDPRIAHVSGDGRLFVMHAGRLFDIIEADALRPGSANVGNLYSDRYFAMIRDRLRPGGLAITWAPTSRVERTFVAVFPYVASYGDFLLGSRDPIVIDREKIRTRLADPAVQAYYDNSGVDIGSLAPVKAIDQAPKMFDPSFDRSTIADINTVCFRVASSTFRARPVVERKSQAARADCSSFYLLAAIAVGRVLVPSTLTLMPLITRGARRMLELFSRPS